MARLKGSYEERRRERLEQLPALREYLRVTVEGAATAREELDSLEARVAQTTADAPKCLRWMTYGLRRELRRRRKQIEQMDATIEQLEQSMDSLEADLSNTYYRIRPGRPKALLVSDELLFAGALGLAILLIVAWLISR